MEDANNLLIHHVKRQTSIHKEDKRKIKVLLKHFLMDRFKVARQEMSEDEREDDDDSGKEDEDDSETGKSGRNRKKHSGDEKEDSAKGGKSDPKSPKEAEPKVEPKDGRRTPQHARGMNPVSSEFRLGYYKHPVFSASVVFLSTCWTGSFAFDKLYIRSDTVLIFSLFTTRAALPILILFLSLVLLNVP